MAENEIIQELKELDSPLAGLSRRMPYALPEGYIAGLAESMAAGAEKELKLSKGMPFQVPPDYVGSLPDTLLEAAKAATVPAKKTITKPFLPAWQKKAAQWAAAAVLVLGLSLGAYRYMQPEPPVLTVTEQLSDLDGNAIHAYLEQHGDEPEEDLLPEAELSFAGNGGIVSEVSKLSDADISQYLAEQEGITDNGNLN